MIGNAVFLGSKQFGLELFKTLYHADETVSWTLMCPPDTNDPRTCLDDYRAFAESENLDMLLVDSPGKVLEYTKERRPDVMIVCGYYRILGLDLFKEVPHGVWGIHNSHLPKYRGGSPLVWQVLNNEAVLGSSFFKLTTGIDDGPILDQVSIANTQAMSIQHAMDLIQKEWINKLPTVWKNFCGGEVCTTEQDHAQATYCAQRQELDGKIDWALGAERIGCFIRAQAHPYPRAFFVFEDKKLRIVEHCRDDRVVYGMPGQVFEVRENYVTICCGDNSAIRITKVEVNGEELCVSEVLKSFKIRL